MKTCKTCGTILCTETTETTSQESLDQTMEEFFARGFIAGEIMERRRWKSCLDQLVREKETTPPGTKQ